MSATITAALAYDENKEVELEALCNGCVHFATVTATATEMKQEYFDNPQNVQQYVGRSTEYLEHFAKQWSRWPTLEKQGKRAEIYALICSMIHTTESDEPAEPADEQRLAELSRWIADRLPTMREAFVEFANR